MKEARLAVSIAVAICSALVVASAGVLAQERGSGRTQVYGLEGQGTRFVYVFDRSLSMKGAPLAAAKRELLASLKKLDRVHQFQIVFYNERPKTMQPPAMTFADDNGLRQAESFVSGIIADGGTDHLAALKVALRMGPDVVFLLTDADEPPLSARQLDELQRASNGAMIHVIEFKSGPATGKTSSLKKVAEQEWGEYKAIDVETLAGK